MSRAERAGAGEHVGIGRVARRRGHAHVEAGERAGQHERVSDVVAVADVREAHAGQAPEALPQREQVGEGLARMLGVGEGIDDRDRCGLRHLDQGVVREGAQDDGVDQARQVARHVGRALPPAEPDLVGAERDGVATEARHRDLEADPRAEARLLEQQRDLAARQRPIRRDRGPIAAQKLGAVEQAREAQAVEVLGAQQVARRAPLRRVGSATSVVTMRPPRRRRWRQPGARGRRTPRRR